MRVKYVEASAICHATEDDAKIRSALAFLAGSDRVLEEQYEGVYGEPIILMRVKEEGKEAEGTLKRILSDPANRRKLQEDLDERIEGWKLYLRLDKQALVNGALVVSSGDNTVKLVVKAGGKAEKEGSKEFFSRYLSDQQ